MNRAEYHSQWVSKNREHLRRYWNNWKKSSAGKNYLKNKKPKQRIWSKESSRRHKLENQARKKVHTALINGTLKKKPCEVCSNPKSEGHHSDYNKPLEVKWLCHKHHMKLHRLKD